MPNPTFNKYRSTTIFGNLSVRDLTNPAGTTVVETASTDLSGNFLSSGDSTFTKAVVCNALLADINANNKLTTKEYVDSVSGSSILGLDNTFTGENTHTNNEYFNSIIDVRTSQALPSTFRVAEGDRTNVAITLPTTATEAFKQIGGLSISQATPVGTPQTATITYDTDNSIIATYNIPANFTKNIILNIPIGIRNTGTAVLSGTSASFTITNLFNSFTAKLYINDEFITDTDTDNQILNSNSATRSTTISYTSTGTKIITLNQYFFNLSINLQDYFDNDFFQRDNGITNTLKVILSANITNTLARVSNTGNFTASINTALITNTTTSTFSASLGTNGTATYNPNSNGTGYVSGSSSSAYIDLFNNTGTTYANNLRINSLNVNSDSNLGNTTINTLTCNDPATFNSSITCNEPATFNSSINFNSNLGNITINTLTCNEPATFNSSITCNEPATFNSSITCNEPVTFNSSINLLPVGMIVPYTGSTAPYGWLFCNGNVYNAQTNQQYQALYNVILNQFGGTDNTDFKVPDYRGAYLRGNGAQAGGTTYVSSALNTSQNHATQTHTHTINHNHEAGNGPRHKFRVRSDGLSGVGFDIICSFPTNTAFTATGLQVPTHNGSSGNNTGTSNANETRPFSFSVNYLIKY